MTKQLEAVFTDLDGSLFNSGKEIDPRDLETIRRLKAQGIKVFFATGRHFSMFHQEAALVGLEFPSVATNGALFYDFREGRSVKGHFIRSEVCRAVKRYFDDRAMPYAVFTDKALFLTRHPGSALSYCRTYQETRSPAFRYPVGRVDDTFCVDDHRVAQFMFQVKDEESFRRLTGELGTLGALDFFVSGGNCVDVTAAGVSKGAALLELAQLYGFSPENTLAMGDSHNDLAMLRACGISVAPANADERVKSEADFISCSCDDGALTHAVNTLFPELMQ